MLDDKPSEGFLRIDFDRGAFACTSTCATRRMAQGGGYPARHGGMMMTVADLIGTMGGGTLVGIAKFLPTVSMTFDFVAPAEVGDWVEGRAEVVRQTRSLLFTNIYLTVGEEKFLRASQIAKIPSGDGLAFGKARLDRGAEASAGRPPS